MKSQQPCVTLHIESTNLELPTDVAVDVAGSRRCIELLAESIRVTAMANAYCRVMLGRQLLKVQELQLWTHYGLSCRTWSQFLDAGFPKLSGLSRETAYTAMQLVKSPTIAEMPPMELRRIPHLSNAIELARLEKKGGTRVSAKIREDAMTLGADAFRATLGKGKRIIVEDQKVVGPLARVVGFLKIAHPDSLSAFAELFEEAKMRSGDNPDDTLDCIMACCREQWRQEDA